MPSQQLHAAGLVLSRHPPNDRFQQYGILTPDHGWLLCLRRLSARAATLDLFDEVEALLESSNQGRTWFIREIRPVLRHAAIGRSYDALRFASTFAAIIARNPGPEESRARTYDLARQTLAAFAEAERSDLVYLKALYCFARDEGYPVKQDWWQNLSAPDRGEAAGMLNRPVAGQAVGRASVIRLTRLLEDYLRGHTEILLD